MAVVSSLFLSTSNCSFLSIRVAVVKVEVSFSSSSSSSSSSGSSIYINAYHTYIYLCVLTLFLNIDLFFLGAREDYCFFIFKVMNTSCLSLLCTLIKFICICTSCFSFYRGSSG